jgi:LuxR family transcriptional regulator, maltose regulon positive regulatory protein
VSGRIEEAGDGVDGATAARLLADHSLSLVLDGRGATVDALLAGFPPDPAAADPELAAVLAGGQVWGGSLGDAAAYIPLAERNASRVPDEGRPRFEVMLGLTRLMLARRRGDLRAEMLERSRRVAFTTGGR